MFVVNIRSCEEKNERISDDEALHMQSLYEHPVMRASNEVYSFL